MEQKKNKPFWNVAELAKAQGIENAYQLHVQTGITHPRTSNFWNGVGKMSPEDMDILCRVLKCSPNDLFIKSKKSKK